VATALTVLTGVIFGLIEAHRARWARQERAALAAVQTLLTPQWMKSMILVHGIADGLDAAAIESDACTLDPLMSSPSLWKDSAFPFIRALFRSKSPLIWSEAWFGWPGENYGNMSTKSGGGADHKRLLNGSNG
jgi:hypothetical protein